MSIADRSSISSCKRNSLQRLPFNENKIVSNCESLKHRGTQVRVSPNPSYGNPFIDNLPHPDIAAMSILSIYEKESKQSCNEMDTNR